MLGGLGPGSCLAASAPQRLNPACCTAGLLLSASLDGKLPSQDRRLSYPCPSDAVWVDSADEPTELPARGIGPDFVAVSQETIPTRNESDNCHS